MYENISGAEAVEKIGREGAQVLDVRSESEYDQSHIPGAVHIPLQQLAHRYQELDASQELVVVCAGGMRSAKACHFLAQQGFTQLRNVAGGMSGYPGETVRSKS